MILMSVGPQTGERYATSEGPTAALAAFSRSVLREPLKATDEGAVRVWTRDYMQGRVQGYILSGDGVLLCRIPSAYADGTVFLGRATCRASVKRATALRAAGSLPKFTRTQWDCPLMDGGEVYIERVHAGQYSSVRVGNPGFCEDSESKAIAAVVSKLWSLGE
jgi:hypothetical protein